MQCLFENRHLIKRIQFLTLIIIFKTDQSTGNTQFVL